MSDKKIFEINGNLAEIPHYKSFMSTIIIVYRKFVGLFGKEVMSRFQLFVDNATEMSGHTPIIMPILNEYLCIKLGIKCFNCTEQIVFQFAHELCHYVFYSLCGIDKRFAADSEESICTAMSLCIVKEYTQDFAFWTKHVDNLSNMGYKNGLKVASEVGFDCYKLRDIILKVTNYINKAE